MMIRSLVASVFAVCGIASVLVPAEASARSGGLTSSRAPVVRNSAPRRAAQPTVHIRQERALATKSAAAPNIHATHVPPATRYRRIFGRRLPRNGIGVYYGSVYGLGDFTWIDGQYPILLSATGTPPLPEDDGVTSARRCGSQAFVVPSEVGGERTVTVTRCISK
jgi:hypothetical protein